MRLSNNGIQRTAPRATADAGHWADCMEGEPNGDS